MLNELSMISCDFFIHHSHSCPNRGSNFSCSHLAFEVLVFYQEQRKLLLCNIYHTRRKRSDSDEKLMDNKLKKLPSKNN